MPKQLTIKGLELIKSFEGIEDGNPNTVNLDPYLDPLGIWTIGWGHAIEYGKTFLRGMSNKTLAQSLYPDGITIQQAEELLRQDLDTACRVVNSFVTVSLNDNQFSALVSFCFNIGAGNFSRSTLLKLLNKGDYVGASEQFKYWVKGTIDGKKVTLSGLVIRREAERKLFMEV